VAQFISFCPLCVTICVLRICVALIHVAVYRNGDSVSFTIIIFNTIWDALASVDVNKLLNALENFSLFRVSDTFRFTPSTNDMSK